MAAIARWLASAWSSKIRCWSLPRSIAISTTRCAEVSRRDDALGARREVQRRRLTQVRTQTPQPRQRSARRASPRFTLRMARIVGRDQRHRLDRAGLDALAAAVALRLVDLGQEVRGVHRVEEAEAPRRDHRLAAAAAAVADEADPRRARSRRTAPAAGRAPAAAGRAPRPRRSARALPWRASDAAGAVEGHADVHRRVAGAAEVLHLVAAVAEADGAMAWRWRPPRWRARSPGRAATGRGGQRGLVDEDPPELRLAGGEEVADEVVLDVQVLVEELGEQPSGRGRRARASSRTRRTPPSAAAARRCAARRRPRRRAARRGAASASSTRCASASDSFQRRAASATGNGRIGSCATSAASRSSTSRARIL